ncbi:2Fe-2S iron-sulfur cluster-binding protein [Croceicoccus estronivorus]|uniref:2Fe-2S iron-sulfur cluster-binding protein n=1 Tax=Croceicoccus estronivorus TaxID=1172626 RepID=UPI0009EF29C7|nr:2Fe-2S iron-sulfur cluster binding domain-containing protein [Croceicoccus estronivorus]
MAGYRISIGDEAEPVRCREGESLLDAVRASQSNAAIISGCRGGGCGICRVRILRGSYRCDLMSRAHLSVEEEAQGFALACRVRPSSDLVVDVIGRLTRCERNIAYR